MKKEPVKVSICSTEEESWDTTWKWGWFFRDTWKSRESSVWTEQEPGIRALNLLFPKLKVKSILHCSCGLGIQIIRLAELGYEVEGSDGSVVAIKYAPHLAKEEGLNIRFFHSRWEELGSNCERQYDCVFSDYFDEIRTRRILKASAKGIYSVLNEGGKFIFGSLPHDSDLKKLIEEEWKKRKRFDILPPYAKDGVRVTSLEVAEKTSEGILENRIFLIEEQGVMRAEIAFIMNPRIKWTFQNYVEVLKEAGFRKVECIKKEGHIFNIGTK